jgi:hypothetical protein
MKGIQRGRMSCRPCPPVISVFAFLGHAGKRPSARLLSRCSVFSGRRDQIVALAARYAIPAIYDQREVAVAGGLMSYGARFPESTPNIDPVDTAASL